MHTTNAMAIYGIEQITPETAYELGMLFFQIIGLAITSSGYYKAGKNISEEDIEFIEASLTDLKREIKANNATSFRLYCESESGALWDASFGYSTTDFGGFYHIDAQADPAHFERGDFLDFINKFCNPNPLSYAIFYSADDVSEGLYYAEDENLVSIYNYESPGLFSKETGGRFKGAERYKNKTLRMVYPINIINKEHLSLQIKGRSLRDWILSNIRHGTLKEISNKTWAWEIESKNLEQVNNELGSEGMLISWKSSHPSRKSKLLP